MRGFCNRFIIRPLIIVGLLASVASSGELSPSLTNLLFDQPSSDSLINVMVFTENNNRSQVSTISNQSLSRSERLKNVTRSLQGYRSTTTDKIHSFLIEHSTTRPAQFWITPAFSATLTLSQIDLLSSMEGVRLVVENAQLDYIRPVELVESKEISSSSASVSNHLNQLKVPELWKAGLTGQGRLVASFDTGVESSHPALSSKWRGRHASLSESWFSKVDPGVNPLDRIGHGTHTMGIMVGSSGSDTIGVAPGAEWITAGVVDQGRSLSLTLADLVEAFQWALNPDGDINTTDDVPDVILNSWGIPKHLFAPCDATFNEVIDAVEAAGIVTIFAAGNEGPDVMSIRSPADISTSLINTFSVGAVDANNVVASFSSRGPSSCDTTHKKPEVVGPGVSIRSSYKGGGYYLMSGSSQAAPFVAGLVALMRQYNPNATVSEIKNALVASATDLGPAGEDNAYGYGLIDASKLLEHLGQPGPGSLDLARATVLGGVAPIGGLCAIEVSLDNIEFELNEVIGHLISVDPEHVQVLTDSASFLFSLGGRVAYGSNLFQIALDTSHYHGQQVDFILELQIPGGGVFASLDLDITAGIKPPGQIMTHDNGALQFTVSDFAQFGFAHNSIYPANGSGFQYKGSENLLYEAGIIIGRSDLQLSSSLRDSTGELRQSDFAPVKSLSTGTYGSDDGFHHTATFSDAGAIVPVPVEINQETVHFDRFDDNNLIIIRNMVTSNSVATLSNMHFGFVVDFDLPSDEFVGFEPALNLIYTYSSDGIYLGLVGLKNISKFSSVSNSSATSGKTGFGKADQFEMISRSGNVIDSSGSGDYLLVATTSAFNLSVHDSLEITYAIIAAESPEQLFDAAIEASNKLDILTSVDDEQHLVPSAFDLRQNYPNPFNPSTTIDFRLAQTSDVTLEIFNLLGQQVRRLHSGVLKTGMHAFSWDATDNSGNDVSTGVYFYRLTNGEETVTKKMVFLK